MAFASASYASSNASARSIMRPRLAHRVADCDVVATGGAAASPSSSAAFRAPARSTRLRGALNSSAMRSSVCTGASIV